MEGVFSMLLMPKSMGYWKTRGPPESSSPTRLLQDDCRQAPQEPAKHADRRRKTFSAAPSIQDSSPPHRLLWIHLRNCLGQPCRECPEIVWATDRWLLTLVSPSCEFPPLQPQLCRVGFAEEPVWSERPGSEHNRIRIRSGGWMGKTWPQRSQGIPTETPPG